MFRRSPGASAGDSNADTRPLPPRPNLERERKHAKALLRQLRAGDSDAFARARARHPELRPVPGAHIALSDAQLVVAREYGFASWPRLVQYFGEVERQRNARHSSRPLEREFYESNARALIAHHRDRRPYAGRTLAASVPRFYGKTVDDVFASSVTEDEARLTVARQNACASWDVLMETIDAERARRADPWRTAGASFELARTAINAADLDALTRAVAEHPALLRPSDEERREWQTVVHVALAAEERNVPGARAITDWLATQGADVGLTVNESLCTGMFLMTEKVRFLLDRGADPDWIAPNGSSALEHALLRYWNGEVVDLIARRATPRPALWIAAGLGDVDGVARFLDKRGKPTAAAYRDRPDFAAAGGPSFMLSTPAPDDTEILAEAFMVAMVNDRIGVLDYMIDRGFPVDYLEWEMPFVSFAAGNQRVRVVECLVRRGADLDVRGRHPDMSGREMARERFEGMPTNPTARRILELCGLDPERVIAEMEATPAPEPQITHLLMEALELAGDDAARQHRPDIGLDSLLVGTLRVAPGGSMELLRSAAVNAELLRAEIGARVLPADDRVQRGKLPLDSATQDLMRAAIAIVRQRKQDAVFIRHVIRALADADDAFLRDLLTRCGSSVVKLKARLGEMDL